MIIYIKHIQSTNRPYRYSRGYRPPTSHGKGSHISGESIDVAATGIQPNLLFSSRQPHQLQTTLLVQEKAIELLKKTQLHAGTCVRESVFDRVDSRITSLNDINSKDVKNVLPASDKHTTKRRMARADKAMQRKSVSTRSHVFHLEPNTFTILNPDCFVQILLDFIYEQVGMGKSVQLDLCDANGEMMRLDSYNKYDMATTLFQENKIYYVVQYELYEDGSYKLLLPILRELTNEDTKVCINIQKNYSGRRTISSNSSIGKPQGRRVTSAI